MIHIIGLTIQAGLRLNPSTNHGLVLLIFITNSKFANIFQIFMLLWRKDYSKMNEILPECFKLKNESVVHRMDSIETFCGIGEGYSKLLKLVSDQLFALKFQP